MQGPLLGLLARLLGDPNMTTERVQEIAELFRRERQSWRGLLVELESSPELGAEDPWHGFDDFVDSCDEEAKGELQWTLEEMILRGGDSDRALAFTTLSSTKVAFDLARTLEVAEELRGSNEVYVEWILVIGQRGFEAGRAEVERALNKAGSRHAAAVALTQLAPADAGEIGREMYLKDREEVRSSLQRPLGEHDYATFFQMTEAVLETRGKDGVNTFLRAVAGDDHALQHEMAEVAARLLRQQREEERLS